MKLRQLDISYAQICVFDACLKDPFNDWEADYVAQGFAWRDRSVSFGTLRPGGLMDLEVVHQKFEPASRRAERVISVPFHGPPEGLVEIASISDSIVLRLEDPFLRLVFEHGLNESGDMWCRFTFERTDTQSRPAILRNCGELTPPKKFRLDAQPAS